MRRKRSRSYLRYLVLIKVAGRGGEQVRTRCGSCRRLAAFPLGWSRRTYLLDRKVQHSRLAGPILTPPQFQYLLSGSAMAKVHEIDGGVAGPIPDQSMWASLDRWCLISPEHTALMAPAQPRQHLQGLVQHDASSSGYNRDLFSPALLPSRIKSWFTWHISRLLSPAPTEKEGISWSFAQLRRGAMRLGFALEEQGIKPGATVLVLVPSCAEWALMLWLCAFKCYTLVTLEATLLEPQMLGELQQYISLLAPSVVVTRNQHSSIAIDKAIMARNNTLPFVGITIEPLFEPRSGWTSLPTIAAMQFPSNVERLPPAPDHPDRIALIIFSSGTSSGRPKGCVRTVRDLLPILSAFKAVPSLSAPAAMISVRNSQSGSPCLLYSTWFSGNAAVLAGGYFNPSTALSSTASCRPIATFFMPHMMEMLRQHHSLNSDTVASLRFISLIGAVLTTSLLKRTQEMFPKAKIVANYGMTEVAGIFGWPQGTPNVDDYPAYRGIISSGMPLAGVKIKIVSEGKAVPRGEPGILHICSHTVCSGYLNGEKSDSFYHEADQKWFVTGDYAIVDHQDRVYILGRDGDMIFKSGLVIAPATIENCLMALTDQRVCKSCFSKVAMSSLTLSTRYL